MLQVRKLVLAVAAATAMSSGVAHALGLGEVTIKSALNQPLLAEVELLEARGLSADEIRSKLASAEDFQIAGVERPFFLTDLKFTPVIRNGRSFVRVTSSQAVREPFLSFLLEVYWPNGRLLKEYTLLLDPPLYSPQQVIYSAPEVTRPVVARPQVQPTPRPRAAVPSHSAQPSMGGSYRVKRNDTLWPIAQKVGGRNYSVHQTMLAIQDLNPDAFIDANINKLKNNQQLRLPTAEQIASRSRAQAQREVEAQNLALRTGRRVTPPEATLVSQPAAKTPAPKAQQDSLRLVAADAHEAAETAEPGEALREELAQAKGKLDSALRENEELASRLNDLDSQNQKLLRLLELQNLQLVNASEDLGQGVAEPVVESGSDAIEQEALLQEEQGSLDTPEQNTAALEQTEPTPVAQPENAVAATPSKPVPAADTTAERDWLQQVLSNELLLPAAGAGAAALLLLLLLVRRKKGTQVDDSPSQVEDSSFNKLAQDAAVLDQAVDSLPEIDLSNIEVPSFADEAENQDPLAEAQGYLNYGQFSQAAQVLQAALAQQPERSELRHKLLAAYAGLEDQQLFLQEFEQLQAGASTEDLTVIRQQYPQFFTQAEPAQEVASQAELVEQQLASFANLDEVLDQLSAAEPDETSVESHTEPSSLVEQPEMLPSNEREPLAFASEPETQLDLEGNEALLDDIADLELDSDLSMDGLELDAVELGEETAKKDTEPQPNGLGLEAELEAIGSELDAVLEGSLPIEGLSQDSSSAQDELAELSLELDSLLADQAEEAQDPAEAQTEDELSLDFDFDLSEVAEQPAVDVEPELAVEEQLEALADLDFSLELDELALDDQTTESDSEAEKVLDDLAFDLALPDLPAGDDLPASVQDEVAALEQNFEFLADADEVATKLDLALALTELGDSEAVRDILQEVLREGSPEQQEQAQSMLDKL